MVKPKGLAQSEALGRDGGRHVWADLGKNRFEWWREVLLGERDQDRKQLTTAKEAGERITDTEQEHPLLVQSKVTSNGTLEVWKWGAIYWKSTRLE